MIQQTYPVYDRQDFDDALDAKIQSVTRTAVYSEELAELGVLVKV